MLLDFGSTHLLAGLLALLIFLIVLWKQKKNLSYLFFFSVFWIYLMGVARVVIFPIHIPDGNLYTDSSLQMKLMPFNFGSCDPPMRCLNATGLLLGYGLFRIFGKSYSAVAHKFRLHDQPIFAYVYDVIQTPTTGN